MKKGRARNGHTLLIATESCEIVAVDQTVDKAFTRDARREILREAVFL